MEYPNSKQPLSYYQSHIRAAHQARSAEFYRLLGGAGRGIGRLVGWLVSPLARTAQWLGRKGRARLAERELEAMDDRLLSDIGLSREDIRHAVRNGREMPDVSAQAPAHPHEAKRAAEVVELRREPDLMGALILHGPWSHYTGPGHKRNDAA